MGTSVSPCYLDGLAELCSDPERRKHIYIACGTMAGAYTRSR